MNENESIDERTNSYEPYRNQEDFKLIERLREYLLIFRRGWEQKMEEKKTQAYVSSQ